MAFDRVRFYPRGDWGYGVGMEKIETIQIPDYKDITINDAIEYYQIKHYFDDGARVKRWTDSQYQEYKEKSKKLYGLCMRFFNALNDQIIVDQHEALDILYRSIFWELFDSCKLYNIISDAAFGRLIQSEHIMPEDLFSYKAIVTKYGSQLKEYLTNSGFGARILVHVYEQDYSIRPNKAKLYLPDELSGLEASQILLQYIESEKPNMNDMLTIFRMRPTVRLPITDEIRLKAKKRYDEFSKVILQDDKASMLSFNLGVTITPDQEEVSLAEKNGLDIHLSYSEKWFLDSMDYPSILNNFIYVFGYVDWLQMRCQLVSTQAEADVIERAMQKELSNLYFDHMSFRLHSAISKMQMIAYCRFLQNQGIQFESVLKWFFTEYLQQVFGCPEIRVLFPSSGTSYAEKCSTLCGTLDSLLKQFNSYADHKVIDFDLISIMSGSIKLTDVHSLVQKKYIYGTGKEFEWVSHMLFSDQSILAYVERIHNQGRNYNSFYSLLSHEDVLITDYPEVEVPVINELVRFGVIQLDQRGQITLADREKLLILMDLYKNEVISRHHYSDEIQHCFDEMIASGMLIENSSLLSTPESDYFNYILNKVEYVNGLDLRNKYSHGVMQVNLDDATHEGNYYTFLKIFTILAIKINDDFCLYEKQQEKENA